MNCEKRNSCELVRLLNEIIKEQKQLIITQSDTIIACEQRKENEIYRKELTIDFNLN